MGQTLEAEPTRSLTPQVGVLLLPRLQRALNYPLLGASNVHKGADSARFSQRVHPHSRDNFVTTWYTTSSGKEFDRLEQDDRLIP